MSLFEELIEDLETDKKIVQSFKPKKTLTDQIFVEKKKGYKMRDDIRDILSNIANEFLDTLGIEIFVHDLVLTGSLANFNWSSFSDVDLHILIDYQEIGMNFGLIKEFFDAKKNVFNEKHNIKVKGYDVELYVQDVNEPHISSGVYSVLHNRWVVKPKREKVKIDDRKILEKGEEYAKKIDTLVKQGKSKDVLSKIDSVRKKLKDFRQSGLESGGEYSYENLTFKLLRRNGYIEKLMKLKTQSIDKKLSVPQ